VETMVGKPQDMEALTVYITGLLAIDGAEKRLAWRERGEVGLTRFNGHGFRSTYAAFSSRAS
jgi:hypothetical protein